MRTGRFAPMAAPALLATPALAPRTRVDNDSNNGNAIVTPVARRKNLRVTTREADSCRGGMREKTKRWQCRCPAPRNAQTPETTRVLVFRGFRTTGMD